MAGKKGMSWKEKNGKYPKKVNSALTSETNDRVENVAKKNMISKSAVIRQCVEKVL